MVASKAQIIPSIRAFIQAPAQDFTAAELSGPKINYFFNVEIIFGAQALTATKIASFRASASGVSAMAHSAFTLVIKAAARVIDDIVLILRSIYRAASPHMRFRPGCASASMTLEAQSNPT